MKKKLTIACILLLAAISCFAQNLLAPVHALAAPVVGRSGFLGYSAALCTGEISYYPDPFVMDVFDGHSGIHYGRYAGTWVVAPAPTFTFNVLTNGMFVDGMSGELVGDWTPYVLKNGKWRLQPKNIQHDIHAWFQDFQLASAGELTREHILGCGGLDIIFSPLQ